MTLRAVPDLTTPSQPDRTHAVVREAHWRTTADPAAEQDQLHEPPTEPSCAIDQMLARARLGWHRITAEQAWAASRTGTLLVDVRTEVQRRRTGELPGSLAIDLTVLEWRLDPSSPHRIAEAGMGTSIILICRQGFSSSLAVARLRALGLRSVTDVIGGAEAWIEAGLPTHSGPADVRP